MSLRRFRLILMTVAACALPLLLTASARATDWYVDNRVGDDGFNGRTPIPGGGRQGPFLSINKALSKVHAADTIHLANQGEPYYESLSLTGKHFSGSGTRMFRILGHGAVLSGARPVPSGAWEEVSENLWKFSPRRKGWYQLINGSLALPEVHVPRSAPAVPPLPAGHWAAWRGAIYYRAYPEYLQSPDELPLAYASDQTGITLVDVHQVEIRDLTIRHFRVDGINVHDRATQIFLENVKLIENGRAGLSVSGASLVGVTNCESRGNRVVQLINSERAQTELFHTVLGDKTGIPLEITGGHVLVDGTEVEVSPGE